MNKRRRPTAPNATREVPAQALAEPDRWEWLCLLLLMLVPMVFNAVLLLPELTMKAPNRNDLPLHWQMIKGASQALAAGRNPLDFWIPQMELGFPQFLYYQNLPHLFVAVVHRLLFGSVELLTVFNATRYLLLLALPLTVFWSFRRMEFSVRTSIISASLATLFANREGYGLEFNGELWLGRGLYSQLWGVHLSFVALACLHRLFRTGTGYVSAILALSALALSHFLLAYMMAMSGVLLWLVVSGRGTLRSNGVRLVLAGAAAVAVSSYMLVPFIATGGRYLAIPPGVRSADYDPATPFVSAVTGGLMDADRLPVLTLLAGVGAVVALLNRNRTTRLALVGTAVWLVLFQLRPAEANALGRLFRYDGHLIYRFVAVLEMFALMLMGVGGEWLWNAMRRVQLPGLSSSASAATRSVVRSSLACGVVLLLLLPMLQERAEFYGLNARTMERTERALAANTNLTHVLDRIGAEVKAQGGGRAYVGLASNWGERMWVGPVIKAYDVLKFSDLKSVAPPYQALSLNADAIWSFKDALATRYDLLDLRYVIIPATGVAPPFFEPVLKADPYALYRVKTHGIAEFGTIVERRAVASQGELLAGIQGWLASAAPDARQFIRWDYGGPGGPSASPPACPDSGRMLSEESDANTMQVVVECRGAATLVFKTTYHPNWRVTVDGKPVPAYMVSPSYIAVDLPPGQHQVRAVYAMATQKWVLLLFGMGVLVLAVVFRHQLDWLPRQLLPPDHKASF